MNLVDKKFPPYDNVDTLENDSDIIVFLLDHCTLTVPTENRFFVNIENKVRPQTLSYHAVNLGPTLAEYHLKAGIRALAYTGTYDFGHTSADWESVIRLGIYGLRNRIAGFADKNTDAEKTKFYNNALRVYDAALRFMKRAANEAYRAGKQEMGDGLSALTHKAPYNLFTAMQTSLVYYSLQQYFERTVLRTLGRLDSLFYPFYKKESPSDAGQLLTEYLKEIDRIHADSNLPFAIGGTDINGNSTVNSLSYALLRTYQRLPLQNTKLHFLCSENMPDDLVTEALDGVRNGKNSIIFLSDEKIIASLEKLGAEKADAVNYRVVGCYECGARDELTCSCNARVNIVKALEYTLNGGRDMLTGEQIGLDTPSIFPSFDALYEEFSRQLIHLCRCAMLSTDLYEIHNPELHASPILSGTYLSALEKGGDLYCNCSAKYNNSSVNAIGIATATDSLEAIRKAVFEDKILTLEDFVRILKSDWEGQEPLRLRIRNRYPKFGQDNDSVDKLARDIAKTLASAINGQPNKKGGVYRLGLFSINWRWEMGAKTAASADGRHAGETLSQNTGATFGADCFGATAHLKSVARIDATDTPNGSVADIDMHISAVQGENGLRAMLATLRTYFALGGFGVHYNILDTEILKKAKKSPALYPNLQVRLCGWNVLFSSLSEKEKDEFIARSEK